MPPAHRNSAMPSTSWSAGPRTPPAPSHPARTNSHTAARPQPHDPSASTATSSTSTAGSPVTATRTLWKARTLSPGARPCATCVGGAPSPGDGTRPRPDRRAGSSCRRGYNPGGDARLDTRHAPATYDDLEAMSFARTFLDETVDIVRAIDTERVEA